MTDRLDELQRLHDSLVRDTAGGVGTVRLRRAQRIVRRAAVDALPALLRVARAAAKLCDNNQSSNWVLSDHGELFAALAELRGTT